MLTECKCHGVSGSCTMKTCWTTLPQFRQVGDNLMKKYYRARPVTSSPLLIESQDANPKKKKRKKLQLLLKKGKSPLKKTPKRADLVFLQMSPNYCERDLAAGSLGTVGRTCNRTSRGKPPIFGPRNFDIIFFWFFRYGRLRLDVLRKRVQHPSVHEDVAVPMQISLVLLRGLRHVQRKDRRVHVQINSLDPKREPPDVFFFSLKICQSLPRI